MHTHLWLMFAALAACLARGSDIPPTFPPTNPVTCGSDTYTSGDIIAAIGAGVTALETGNFQNGYPVPFYNDERLTLYCPGNDWYEYPILANHRIYTSADQSPGPDRVVFTSDRDYCAVITKTGASTSDGFVACEGDSPNF